MFCKHKWKVSQWGDCNKKQTTEHTFFDLYCMRCGKTKRVRLKIILEDDRAGMAYCDTRGWKW